MRVTALSVLGWDEHGGNYWITSTIIIMSFIILFTIKLEVFFVKGEGVLMLVGVLKRQTVAI